MHRKILVLLLFICGLSAQVRAQNEVCPCSSDLKFLDAKIRKTPAYKINKKAYESSYSKILKKVAAANTIFDCQVLLNTLLISLNDNHSKVYSVDKGATVDIKANPDKFVAFKNSKIFNAFPKPKIDLDSLKTVLNTKPKEDIEGIYTRNNYITIGVYKSKLQNSYRAVVLNSETEVWVKGEIAYDLIPFGNDYLLSIGGSLSSKRLIAYTERIGDGFFYFMGFQKEFSQPNYASIMPSDSTYYRNELSNNITYLKVGSFNSWYPTLSDAENFYKSLEGNLNKSNLIIDLRNNGGGGDRNSDILYKIIKKYAKTNKVYVLINHKTVSNAEQFAYKLSRLDNSLLFGQRTNGTLAYEIKGDNYTLPCGNFIAVLTSKKDSDYLQFESQGIEPNITLSMETDWILQLTRYIEKNN
ncbi:S41 family peptidase [Cellulophaga sp. F20128]|uniref:S41 family peptidase n=1 Tax=Cellulophaga sp. F20128 TaxID=2926413 RepID=UPI001FF4A48B|nr:S41 family peptidase [Cellulophaga sp. F20128]MCK0157736.1 S41 family peptidase [Cellulophaga sp. F20128]